MGSPECSIKEEKSRREAAIRYNYTKPGPNPQVTATSQERSSYIRRNRMLTLTNRSTSKPCRAARDLGELGVLDGIDHLPAPVSPASAE